STARELIDEQPDQGPHFIKLLPIQRAVHVFSLIDFPVQERIIKKLPGHKISEIITEMPPDNRTTFFSALHGDVLKELIILLPQEERVETLGLLGYNEDSVGRLMTPDYIAVKTDWNVA